MVSDNKKIAKDVLTAFKLLGVTHCKWEKDKWEDGYLLYLFIEKGEQSKREIKKDGTQGIFMLLDGTECENIAILFEVLEQILLVEDKICYNIDEVIKVVEKWKKNG